MSNSVPPEAPPPSYEAATGGQSKQDEKLKLEEPGINPGYSSLNPESARPESTNAGSTNLGATNPAYAYPGPVADRAGAYPAPSEVVIIQPQSDPLPPGERMRAQHHGELAPPEPERGPDDCCGDPDHQTCCCCCRVTISTLAHLGFLAGIAGLIVAAATYGVRGGDPRWLPFAITAGVCYGLLWLESWCSHDFSYLTTIKTLEEFKLYISGMHVKRPAITMSVECYHYETRYRTVYSTDANGNTTSTTESYTERVVSHREKETFEYRRCRETSPPNINLDNIRATRVTFYCTWHFADHATKGAYDSQYQSLQDRNRHRDTYMDSHEHFQLEGFQKRMLAYVNPASNHPCYHPCAYICASWFVLTWPYRWWFKSSTGRTNYTFDKEIGL